MERRNDWRAEPVADPGERRRRDVLHQSRHLRDVLHRGRGSGARNADCPRPLRGRLHRSRGWLCSDVRKAGGDAPASGAGARQRVGESPQRPTGEFPHDQHRGRPHHVPPPTRSSPDDRHRVDRTRILGLGAEEPLCRGRSRRCHGRPGGGDDAAGAGCHADLAGRLLLEREPRAGPRSPPAAAGAGRARDDSTGRRCVAHEGAGRDPAIRDPAHGRRAPSRGANLPRDRREDHGEPGERPEPARGGPRRHRASALPDRSGPGDAAGDRASDPGRISATGALLCVAGEAELDHPGRRAGYMCWRGRRKTLWAPCGRWRTS